MAVNELGVHRRNGSYPVEELRASFQKNGIVILREFISADSKSAIRLIAERKLAEAQSTGNVLNLPIYPKADFLLGDILAVRELAEYEYIFFRRELLDVLRVLLDSEQLIYFGDSSIQYGEGGRGFHKDNVDRYDGTKDDWKSDYDLIRCGFYMQDHVRHSGGLKIRLSSHNIPTHTDGKMVDVSTEYGDMVVWNMRLTHSGNNRKLKFLPKVSLHPRLEMIFPSSFTAPEQMRRISAFCAFSRPGPLADHYIHNLDVREADYKAYLQRARKREEAVPILTNLGISLRMPGAYYGELD